MVFSDPIFGFLPASLVIFHLLRIYVGGTPAVWALKPPLLNYVMFVLFFRNSSPGGSPFIRKWANRSSLCAPVKDRGWSGLSAVQVHERNRGQ